MATSVAIAISGEHDRGRVGARRVEVLVALLDVQRQRLGLADDPARRRR